MKIKPSVSKVNQAVTILRDLLRKEYFDGGRFLSETELAEELGVSRGTIRQTLAILQQEGIIYRKQGSGTFANQHALNINTRIEHSMEFSRLIRDAGYRSDIKAIGIKKGFASEDLANRLEIDLNSPIYEVEKVFLANDKPAIFLTERIPHSLISKKSDEKLLSGPILVYLEKYCNIKVDYTLAVISPIAIEKRIANLLEIKPGTALIGIDEVFFTENNDPKMQVSIVFVDSIIKFSVKRKMI